MVEIQLVARGISDEQVLEAMRRVPRHLFVPEDLQDIAYGDHPLSIGEGQTISQPYMVALMTQLLVVDETDKILEIGTGSGYQAAILAELGDKVFTVERIASLSQKAEKFLRNLGYRNIFFKIGDGTLGWGEFSPFDKIMVTAGSPDVSKSLVDQLVDGGRMVVPIGDAFTQILTTVDKVEGQVKKSEVCGCTFVPLIGEQGWKDG